MAKPSRLKDASRWLQRPVDGQPLALFRIGFGLVVLIEIGRYFSHGWIDAVFVAPSWLVPFPGLAMPRYPGYGLQGHFVVLGVAAAAVAVGFCYRLAAWVLALGLTYVFLLDASYSLELNHFYLMVVLCFYLACSPADRVWSLRSSSRRSAERSVPYWSVLLPRMQIITVFFFAGLAKLNPSWLQSHPTQHLLASNQTPSFLKVLAAQPGADLVIVYGGLVLDLLLPWLWLVPRTRRLAFILTAGFMTMNGLAFNIGVFPAMLIVTCVVFLPVKFGASDAVATVKTASLNWRSGLVALGLFGQVLIPARAWLYPQPTGWSEEGHFFSWRMMLIDKTGDLQMTLVDPATGRSAVWDPERGLTPLQLASISTKPLLVHQYALHVANEVEAKEGFRPQVHVEQRVRYGALSPQLIIDPEIDLAAQEVSILPAKWIRPLITKHD